MRKMKHANNLNLSPIDILFPTSLFLSFATLSKLILVIRFMADLLRKSRVSVVFVVGNFAGHYSNYRLHFVCGLQIGS